MKVRNFGRKSWKKGSKEMAESDGAVTFDPKMINSDNTSSSLVDAKLI